MGNPDDKLLTKSGEPASPRWKTGASTPGLPVSLLRKASRRLQAVSLSVVILVAIGWLGGNWVEGELAAEFQTPLQWASPMTLLVASLITLGLARSSWLTPSAVVIVGLVYEVVVAFSIPLGQYWNTFAGIEAQYISGDLVGVSPVAFWMLFFTVLVPAKPRHALIALTLSASAVPITIGLLARFGDAPVLPPMDFAFVFVLPYVPIIVLSYIAARIIYGLGTDIRRAREMGSYHLLELIGRGGMGEVWRGRHNMLARPAALKLIRSDALGSDAGAVQLALARFEREAQVTASLQSPHTVELYDYGVAEDGSVYYVMELLEGIDLESLVHRFGPLVVERVVYILRQACFSLGEAHSKDLIHRDIKPANLYLCRRALDYDFVKVLDFGLVKRGSTVEARAGMPVTETGAIAGTPDFMAPEMAVGDGTVDGRADLYALGCVAHWLLTGRRPFERDTAIATIVAHINTPAEPPSAHTELPIPAQLDSLVLTCLAKDPAARPATAEDLLCRLDGIALPTPWTRDRAGEWWRLHLPENGPALSEPGARA